jgi:pimeloyl-ACP methyl ester carboxylesterase
VERPEAGLSIDETSRPRWLTVSTRDRRRLEVVVAGPLGGRPLVLHGGTPSAAVPDEPLIAAAAARGLQTIAYSRPGYAASTEHRGRSVASAAADVAAILDALETDTFVTLGRSGGGPHALACAALLPDRCRAAATVAGVAPYPADGLDWLSGMGKENIEEFTLAIEGEAALAPWLEREAAKLGQIQAKAVATALGDVISGVDAATLHGEFADYVAETLRRSVSTGIAGWRDDDLALARPWGFALDEIARPVTIWQGGEDRMVPMAHGEWLAAHIHGATAHVLPAEGHLSLGRVALERIIDDLAGAAGRS